MSHIDPDDLAMAALGDLALNADAAAHLSQCATCADELAALEQTVTVARGAHRAGLAAPAPHVWDAVAREIAADPTDADPTDTDTRLDRSEGRDGAHRAPRSARLSRRLAVLAGGLVATAAVVVLVVTLITPRPIDIATATLDAFPDHPGARGSATLERESDGVERVIVDLDADLADTGHREVWLLTPDGSDLVSLGILDGTTGSFTIPADVDTARFSVVDISQEPDDGDHTHSGDSIVRGQLESS
ncbi:MAG: anti-sigma factor [Candidatus Microbacterium phytovorans]|uniref:Anti-sigma factor n=1 Tax=Candidatus Microbacterium phytovorans TaxID=3121374 RepID=A0AAJ5W5I3_9MICO|nr:anti-sigma factor [Microbacterium sp.]WEK14625.1 MAG: anti-sigma factor [Microbacterium sp.]